MKDAFELFDDLQYTAIAENRTDEKLLEELTETMFLELKQTKRSDILDRLYTASLYYSYLPRQNKRTYPEIRVKPVSMGVSGTDAMLLIQILCMRVKSKDYKKTEEYKTAVERLFSSYTMSPSKVSNGINNSFRTMNTVLCQQGALAHFGSDEQKDMYSYESDKDASKATGNKPDKANRAGKEINANEKFSEEKAEGLREATKKECMAMLTRADAEAKAITEKAKSRANVMLAEADAEIAAKKEASRGLIAKSEADAKTIIENAKARERVIDSEAKVKEEKTKEECVAMLVKADAEAGKIIENARKRERIISADVNVSIEKRLSELLAAATDANKTAVSMQAEIAETYPNKYASDLVELYTIIGDTKDATQDEKCRKNLESFMGAIEDMLYKYGFEAIKTQAGAAFDGKLHEADRADFNPKTAVIESSKRCGFMSKTKVLCKERVSVKK